MNSEIKQLNGQFQRFMSVLRKGHLKKSAYLIYYKISTLLNSAAPPFPVHAILGSTNICNLKCRMCPRRDPRFNKEMNAEMTFEQFKMLIDQMPYIISVTPEALGEPFLHKEIFDMIKYAKSKGIDVYLHSNGTIINKDMAEKIIDSGLDALYFSFDAPTKKTYEDIRIGANFETVVQNITNLVKLRNEKKSPLYISLKPVLMQKTLKVLPLFVDLMKKMGVTEASFNDVSYFYEVKSLSGKKGPTKGATPLAVPEQSLRMSKTKKQITEIFDVVQKGAEKSGLKISLPNLDQPKSYTQCRYPWTTLTVTPLGLVRPCCGVHTFHLGNVFEENIINIWNKPEFVAWRNAMKSSNPPEICLHCTSF